MSTDTIRDILSTYAKHGWTLRRVLLSAPLAAALGDEAAMLFAEADIIDRDADIDAAWFSRPQPGGRTAWEIRYLGPSAYALVMVIDDEDETDEIFQPLQQQLAEAMARRPTEH